MSTSGKIFPVKKTLNCKGMLLSLEHPVVMGILNLTPDSFYDGGKFSGEKEVLQYVERMINEGAAIIDIGGISTRPGAEEITIDEELKRVIPIIQKITSLFPDTIISIDTYRSKIAEESVKTGASIINDISAGQMENGFIETVARLKAPYILMHMQGTPKNMQENPQYKNVTMDVFHFLKDKIFQLEESGIKDILVDPGFGFGKTVTHNYSLLKHLSEFNTLGCPVIVSLSRKSMIYKVLKTTPAEALNGTTVLNTLALLNGCSILRTHDVKEAKQAIELLKQYDAAL